mmetsp:Transcript_45804/g.120130  ORF Transcript_45804/g.120130 Transcript_45804/m.120130 type:complete len:201 (-) Transcript_45804:779-1381(-)
MASDVGLACARKSTALSVLPDAASCLGSATCGSRVRFSSFTLLAGTPSPIEGAMETLSKLVEAPMRCGATASGEALPRSMSLRVATIGSHAFFPLAEPCRLSKPPASAEPRGFEICRVLKSREVAWPLRVVEPLLVVMGSQALFAALRPRMLARPSTSVDSSCPGLPVVSTLRNLLGLLVTGCSWPMPAACVWRSIWCDS